MQGAGEDCQVLGRVPQDHVGQDVRACEHGEETGRVLPPSQALEGGAPLKPLPPSFKYILMGVHRSALERQVKEALLISGDRSDFLLNSKSEYGRNCLVTRTITFDGKELMQDAGNSTQHQTESPKRKRQRQEAPILRRFQEDHSEKDSLEEVLPPTPRNRDSKGKQSMELNGSKKKELNEASSMELQRNVLRNWLRGPPKKVTTETSSNNG